MSSGFDDLQPEDDTDVETAANNTIKKRIQDIQRDRELTRDARIRELLPRIEKALTGSLTAELDRSEEGEFEEDDVAWGEADPNPILAELGELIEGHDEMPAALIKRVDNRHAIRFKNFRNKRKRGLTPEDLLQEHAVYSAVARALDVFGAYTDRSQYAPVRMEVLDHRGAESAVEDGEQTPIGRLRIGAGDGVELDDRITEIPLRNAHHTIVVGDPRAGKDSTIVSALGNLKDEHNYKWISVWDPGRNENQMIAIPSDDKNIQRNLESFGQSPKGYKTTVYIPAVELPDKVPSNHEPFSIGVDSLTPQLLARVTGKKIPEESETRVARAVEEVKSGDGEVRSLIRKLEKYAEDTNAVVTITGVEEGDEDSAVEEITFEMGEDELLRDIAQSVTRAAGKGFIRDRGASTNIDMEAVLKDQDRVAVLNANHLDLGSKKLMTLLWLQLIWEVRSTNPDLPRVALEVRELKDLSINQNSEKSHPTVDKGLGQAFFDIGSRGSARRVTLLGSTQKLTDVQKSVRSNMKILLAMSLSPGKISDINYSVSRKEYNMIANGFSAGWGMLFAPSGGSGPSKHYPIQFRGARCGLDDNDRDYLDRYGETSGWRVADGTEDLDDDVVYFNGFGERVTAGEAALESGDWWLLPRDVDGYESVEAALEDRARDGLPEVFIMEDPADGIEDIDMTLMREGEAAAAEMEAARKKLPPALRGWLDADEEMRERWVLMLQIIRENDDVTSYASLAELSPVSKGTVVSDMNGALDACTAKEDGVYTLTKLGEQALDHEDVLTRT